MGYNPNFRGNTANVTSRSARSVSSTFQNGSGSFLPQCTPVATNGFGQLIPVDVSNEATVTNMVGVLGIDLPNAASGTVFDGGRLEDVNLPSFAVGDSLYVDKTGFLTNIKPEEGVNGFVAGDFVIFIGVVVKNEFNVLLKDVKLLIDAKIGQL